MNSTVIPDEEVLPSPINMERDDVLELFVRLVNLVEPEHKYDISYPISTDDIQFSYTTRYWAKCGPRHAGGYYAVNMDYFNSQSIERILAINAHEMGHLKYGVSRGKPTHPEKFWQAMAFYASEMRDELDTIRSWFDYSVEQRSFEAEVVNDPNNSTVDGRIETVDERRNKMSQLLGLDPKVYVR